MLVSSFPTMLSNLTLPFRVVKIRDCVVIGYLESFTIALSLTTNFRLFQTERVSRQQFQSWWKWKNFLQACTKHSGEKEKLLVMSNFSFSHIVFKRLLLQTCKIQGFFKKGLTKLTFAKLKTQINFETQHLFENQLKNLRHVYQYLYCNAR